MKASSEKGKDLRLKNTTLSKMALKLKKTSWKQNIMRECCECFFDGNFINLLDKNTELLSFKNGVLDIANKEFRESRSDDYLSLSTNTDYIEYDPNNPEHVEIRGEITEFMEQLFPDPSLNTGYRFPANIKLETQNLILKNGQSLPLQAGMSITANIKLRPEVNAEVNIEVTS